MSQSDPIRLTGAAIDEEPPAAGRIETSSVPAPQECELQLRERLRDAESLLSEILRLAKHLGKTGQSFLTFGHENRIRKFLCLLPTGPEAGTPQECECPARDGLELLKGAGDRRILPGSVVISESYLDRVIAALSAPCPCAQLRQERDAYLKRWDGAAGERDSRLSPEAERELRAERDTALSLLDQAGEAIAEYRHWFDTCTKTLILGWEGKADAASDVIDAVLAEIDAARKPPGGDVK